MDILTAMNNYQTTENGAIGYKSVNPIVDLNFKIPSFRNGIDKNLFDAALNMDENLTLRWLLYLRDIREGAGERQSFRDFFLYFCNTNPEMAYCFIQIVPVEEYGRWDDLIYVYSKTSDLDIQGVILEKIQEQLAEDMISAKPSLLSKWMPSISTSSRETRKIAYMLARGLHLTARQYRKNLSKLRKKINVLETQISAKKWNEVNYEHVPSKANIRYKEAFFRNDRERRLEYLESLSKGEKKINANAMFLYDIVHAYSLGVGIAKEVDKTLEELWKAQAPPRENFENTLVVRDGSGSMMCHVGNSNVMALEVADAITLYLSQHCTGYFKDRFITFSSYPKIVDVSGINTLHNKLRTIRRHDDFTNTNIEAVFNLLLTTALDNNLTQEELPKSIVIISDMCFDSAVDGGNNKVLFKTFQEKYEKNGYKLPKLIFWNVNSRTNTIPLTQNENGVILVSGFSKSITEMVLSQELDPFKALEKELRKARYDVVEKVFQAYKEMCA